MLLNIRRTLVCFKERLMKYLEAALSARLCAVDSPLKSTQAFVSLRSLAVYLGLRLTERRVQGFLPAAGSPASSTAALSWYTLPLSNSDSFRPSRELGILGMNITFTSEKKFKTSSSTSDVYSCKMW